MLYHICDQIGCKMVSFWAKTLLKLHKISDHHIENQPPVPKILKKSCHPLPVLSLSNHCLSRDIYNKNSMSIVLYIAKCSKQFESYCMFAGGHSNGSAQAFHTCGDGSCVDGA